MRERVVSIQISPNPKKKYRAIVASTGGRRRVVDFGAIGYQQYRDSTPLKRYRVLDHGDLARRKRFMLRHMGVEGKTIALKKARAQAQGRVNARILSLKYLW